MATLTRRVISTVLSIFGCLIAGHGGAETQATNRTLRSGKLKNVYKENKHENAYASRECLRKCSQINFRKIDEKLI